MLSSDSQPWKKGWYAVFGPGNGLVSIPVFVSPLGLSPNPSPDPSLDYCSVLASASNDHCLWIWTQGIEEVIFGVWQSVVNSAPFEPRGNVWYYLARLAYMPNGRILIILSTSNIYWSFVASAIFWSITLLYSSLHMLYNWFTYYTSFRSLQQYIPECSGTLQNIFTTIVYNFEVTTFKRKTKCCLATKNF